MNEQKLLLDQNLSYRLVRQIADVFPNAEQVGNLGLYNSDDKSIWQYAKDNDFAIVTFDADRQYDHKSNCRSIKNIP